jgi:hypothetical protein
MRPGDLLYFVPAPIGSGALFAQEQWLPGLLVAIVLAALGACAFLLRALVKDIRDAGGLWEWQRKRYEVMAERETARDNKVEHTQRRRIRKREWEHQRREYERQTSSRREQLRFPWEPS